MSQKINNKRIVLSQRQLNFFEKEINTAGGFDELMIQKQALESKDSSTYILTYNNINEYKKIYLTGVYKSLCPYFKTNVPYSFWSQLYILLKKNKNLSNTK